MTKSQWQYLAMAFVIFLISGVFLLLPFALPSLRVGHWNWMGKLLSICATYLVVFNFKAGDAARRFVTFRQRPGSGSVSTAFIALLLLTSVLVNVATGGGNHTPTWETVFYEASMPGIDEETVFRAGVLGSLVAGRRVTQGDDRWVILGSVLVTSILFGLVHAVTFSTEFRLGFDWLAFVITAVIGTLLALLAINSGSILLPVIVHNLVNCLSFIF
ncbi:CPBP family intramembrane glutamic endopeptidase [Burkholderia sp. PAMC 26561]|uniref:CPBP family intramembrane glutamic endopeptidase n=1 Tax=Burkholderia sp. PAMC 26561 TaxID=1795043 RepID=UPI0013C44C3F|nr:CPBP family intramembrane glutamic endopeptidase [Burkholderia sp. PAMC 26561]